MQHQINQIYKVSYDKLDINLNTYDSRHDKSNLREWLVEKLTVLVKELLTFLMK